MWGKYDVLCVGSATVDNYLFVEKPFSSLKLGDKALVKSFVVHSGGGATNSAVALSRFGLRVKVLSKLGKDHDAEFIQRELLEHRIENLCIHHSKKHTDVSTIMEFRKNRDRIILTHKGASTNLSFEDVPTARLSCRWIYLATLMGTSLATAKQLAALAQKKNIPLLFNPSLYLAEKGKRSLQPILNATRILVLNLEEAQALAGKKLPVLQLLKELQSFGLEIVIITDSSRRLYARCRDKCYSLMPPSVKVVHTTGAGDAFTAAFLGAYIKGHTFADCLRLGQVNSTSVIQDIGVKHRLLTHNEAVEKLNKYKINVREEAYA